MICSTNNKKSGTGLHNSMATQNSSKAQSVSSYGPTGHHALAGVSTDPPIPYLLVDSVDKIEIVICFTSLSKWLDPPQPIVREKGRDSVSIYGEVAFLLSVFCLVLSVSIYNICS